MNLSVVEFRAGIQRTGTKAAIQQAGGIAVPCAAQDELRYEGQLVSEFGTCQFETLEDLSRFFDSHLWKHFYRTHSRPPIVGYEINERGIHLRWGTVATQ